ncbi:Abhydrolase-3 domain-containing protein [Fusarium sp. LHS14.1]|nr:Abhydrolase-3 domain-containing protein [Fusarium sp. LHS14.1]
MFQWAYHNAAALGGEPNKLYTIGTSAGGALAFAVARKVALGSADLPKNSVKGIAAFSPVMFHPDDVPERYSSQRTSFKDNEKDTPIIDVASLMSFFNACNVKADDVDYFVGLDQANHALFPPTYIVTCGLDPLRDDGKVVAGSMKNQGISVRTDHYDGLSHCFWMFPTLPETREFLQNAFSGVKWVIESM